jgi:hypothetical protein
VQERGRWPRVTKLSGAALEELEAPRPTLNMSDAPDPQRVLWVYDQISEKVTA